MPRKPTGNPTGRPKGSGMLGEITRFTVRLPTELYTRLELFAEGRSYTRGTPELSGCVRELLEHALACPYKRQTQSIPEPYSNGQTKRVTEISREEIQQTIIYPETVSNILQQTESEQVSTLPVQLDAADLGASHPASVGIAQEPAYTPTTDVLGALCVNGHDWQGSGQSPRRRSDGECRQCRIDRNAAYKANKRAKQKATRQARESA